MIKRYQLKPLQVGLELAESILLDERAGDMGLGVIAEGAETKEQCQFLVNAECTSVQGSYFARPLSAAELEKRLIPVPIGASSKALVIS